MASSGVSPEIRAYLNLGEFVKHRRLVLRDEPLRPDAIKGMKGLTPAETVTQMLAKFGRWKLVAVDANSPNLVTVIFLVAESSKYAHASGELRGLLASATQGLGEKDVLREVILIVPEEMAARSGLAAVVAEANSASAKSLPAGSGPDAVRPLYNMYENCKFADVVPDSPLVPDHQVISAEEAHAYLRAVRMKPQNLPLIRTATDAAAIWIGARPGDFVLVNRISETAGRALALRLGV